MSERRVLRFDRRTDSRACTMDWLYTGTATAIRIMMMLMTIISSSRVNPRKRFMRGPRANMRDDALQRELRPPRPELVTLFSIYQSLYFVPSSAVPSDLL